MGDRRADIDRTNPMRSLSQAIARGTLQVLQQSLRGQPQPLLDQAQRRGGGPSCSFGDPDDLAHRCEYCGVDMGPSIASKKFCSEKCRYNAFWGLERAALDARNAGRTCVHCREPMPVSMKGTARYCSEECRSAARWVRQRYAAPPKTCQHCGSTFGPLRPDQQYCSRRCFAAATRVLPDVSCGCCGVAFQPRRRSSQYCSRSCATKVKLAAGIFGRQSLTRNLTVTRLDRMLAKIRPAPPRPRIRPLTATRFDWAFSRGQPVRQRLTAERFDRAFDPQLRRSCR